MLTLTNYVNEPGYLALLSDVWSKGEIRGDRTGVGTRSLFGVRTAYDLSEQTIPIFTTKKVAIKSVVVELEWMLRGGDNIQWLEKQGVTIWTEWPFVNYLKKTGVEVPSQNSIEWKDRISQFRLAICTNDDFAKQWGSIGKGAYGAMWREWPGTIVGETIDQILASIQTLKKDPHSRRNIVVAFNPSLVSTTYLPPCHSFFQLCVDSNNGLYLLLTQRSGDLFLGIPFNVASYGILTHVFAKLSGLDAKGLIHVINDAHIYNNHAEQIKTQILRDPTSSPKLILPEMLGIDDFEWKKVLTGIQGYWPQASIKGEVAV